MFAVLLKGGSKLLNEKDVFSFDLNESLYFEKGQGVSEMIGISLDPEISIQPFNEYVSIRGVIELHGEYRKAPEKDDAIESLNFDDDHSRRYLEKIEDTTDDRAEFSHRFPVEISVPSYRVADINDISVSVESFDYEIPEENQMKLTSTIEIHGISNQTEYPKKVQERLEKETFEFDIKEESSEDETKLVARKDEVDEQDVAIETDDEDPIDKDRWKHKKTQSLQEFFKEKPVKEVEDLAEEVEEIDLESDIESPEIIMDEEMDLELVAESEPEQVEDVEREHDLEEDYDTDSEESVHYLADMFSNNVSDREEQYTQMRICIVQDKDTLETISERYQIPKLQLLKQNRLENDDILEGQLLSIPIKKEQ